MLLLTDKFSMHAVNFIIWRERVEQSRKAYPRRSPRMDKLRREWKSENCYCDIDIIRSILLEPPLQAESDGVRKILPITPWHSTSWIVRNISMVLVTNITSHVDVELREHLDAIVDFNEVSRLSYRASSRMEFVPTNTQHKAEATKVTLSVSYTRSYS